MKMSTVVMCVALFVFMVWFLLDWPEGPNGAPVEVG